MGQLDEMMKEINARTTVFFEVDCWKAYKENGGSYVIKDSHSRNVALLNINGQLYFFGFNGERHVKADRKFNPETELIQAVRYSFLMKQQPKQRKKR